MSSIISHIYIYNILKEKYKNIEVLKDLSGNNRCVIAQKE